MEIVHNVWFRKHFLRRHWDTRTVADSRPLDDPPPLGNSETLLVWLRSMPKPLISARDFLYAYRCVDVSDDGKTRLYAGASLDPDVVASHAGLKAPAGVVGATGCVRAWLQGCGRVEALEGNKCRMTYCLRVRPMGDLPKFVVQAVANETVYTLFDLRKRCEAAYARRRKRKKALKKRMPDGKLKSRRKSGGKQTQSSSGCVASAEIGGAQRSRL